MPRFFDTARRRRIRLYGSWSIEYGVSLFNASFSRDIKVSSVAAGFRPVVVGTPDLWVQAGFNSSITVISGTSYRYRFFLTLRAFNTTVSFTLADFTQHPDLPVLRTFNESGTFDIACDMEEYWWHENGRVTTPDPISRLAPAFDLDDVPTRRTFVTQARVGGNVTARITSSHGEALDSRTITSTHRTDWGTLNDPYASGGASTFSKHAPPSSAFPSGDPAPLEFPACSVACSGYLELQAGGVALGVPTLSLGPNAPGSSANQSSATAALGYWATTPGNPALSATDWEGTAGFTSSMKPVQRHRLTADLRNGAGGYVDGSWDILVQEAEGTPTTLETVTITGGRLDRTYTRDARQVSLALGGGGGGMSGGGSSMQTSERLAGGAAIESPTTFPDVPSLVIAPASLTAHGSPLVHPRLLLRGRKWLSRRLAQAASYSYGRTGLAGAWESSRVTAETHITSSITGGVLRLVASGSFAGGKAAVLDSQSDRAEFRHHRLRWRRVDAGTGTMQIKRGEMSLASDPMVWDCPAAGTGTWAEATRDVLDPDDTVPDVVAASMSPDVEASTLVANWEIHLPSGAGTWELDYLEGVRQDFTTGTILSAPMPGLGGSLDACTDGMSLSDWEGPSWRTAISIAPSGSKPWSGAPWSWGSWTWGNASPDITDVSYWYDGDLGVNYYESGDGMLLDGDALAIPTAIDLRQAASSGADPALTACDLWERVVVYPGAGDIFFESGGGFGETVTYRFGTIIGPRAVGVVRLIGGGTMPQVGAYNNSTLLSYAGSPGTQGYYTIPATLERSGASPGSHELRLIPETDTGQRESFTVGSGSGQVKDRETVYTLWRVTAEGEGIALARSATGRITRAFNEAGTIRLEHLAGPDLATWIDGVDTGEEGQDPDIAYVGTDGRLYLSWTTDTGAIKRAWTVDEGRTLEDMTTVFTGSGYSISRMAPSPTGVVHHFALYDDSGTTKIRTRALDPQGNELIAVTTIVASDVADGSLAACWLVDGPMIEYRKLSTGNVVTVASTDGVTFA